MKKIKDNLHYKLTLLLMLLATTAFSQAIEWQNTIGGGLIDQLSSIQQTNDGGYILGGQSTSDISGDKTENSLGGIDYWIVKTDSLGVIQWQNTIGGNLDDALRCIQQTADGGYIIGGTSNSNISGDKTENSNGDDDYWIVKTDAIGNIQWQNTIGGSNDDWLFSIQQTSDGGFIIGGTSWSNTSGDKNENIVGMGGNDFWIVKVDALGNIQWQNTIGGSNIDWLYSIKQSFDGGYFIGGRSTSGISGDKTENALGFEDYWIVKTDSVGNIQWQNTIGGNNTDALTTVELTADGGYIIGGFSGSGISGDKTEKRKGIWDYWVLKIDSIGNIQWQRTIGGSGADALLSLQQTDDGGYIFGGSSGSPISGDKTENSMGVNNYWVIKTDAQGLIIWQNTMGGLGDDQLTSLQQTNDGGFILGGHSNSLIAGDKTENSNGNFDYWMVKLNNSYNIISGKLFADLNSNSAIDVGESVLTGRKVIEQNNGEFAFTDHNGDYSLVVFDSGNFTVAPTPVNWYNPVPASHAVTFSTIYETDSLNDFAFQPQGAYNDVCITISPLGSFRSGLNAFYQISYSNYGTTTLSPTVIFYPAGTISFLSATVTPGLITPDSVLWNLPSLAPFQTGTFVVTVNVNSGLPIGTLINSSVHIEPFATDVNPSCNNSNWEVYTTGSLDPNDILVNEDTLTTTQLSNAPWLEYIIRFQNTGNDTAFTVKILNPIDTSKLNLSSFEFVNASHPINLNWINYQRNMEFKFENILLPDSNTNEPLSHGFVRYRIQPKTNLSAGDSITNFAAIYFDFNEPVITNTAKTIIILPTGIASASPTLGKLHVFPNPAENSINISGIQLKNGKAQLRLTDIYGKLILAKTITTSTATLETDHLSTGIYLIQSGGMRATFVKQ